MSSTTIIIKCDSYLRLYTSNFTQIAFNDDGCGAQSILSTIDVTAYDTVWVVVEGFGSSVGNYTVNITQAITTLPTADISYPIISYCEASNQNFVPTNNGSLGGIFSETSNNLSINPTTGEITLNTATAGTYDVYYLVGQGSCTAIDTSKITVHPANGSVQTISACNSYTWINGVTYTSSNNTATDTLTNMFGCDSIVTLNLTINNATTGTAVITACDSYTWINGVTYTSSNNTAMDTLTNAVGCDSIVTLNLTINNATTGTAVITACNSYTWINGVTYTSSNNTAMDTLTNAVGCDSIVTLNLTINTISSIATSKADNTITATNALATYVWLDCNTNYSPISGETSQSFAPVSNGDYAVQLSQNGCIDTSVCVTISTIGLKENTDLRNVTIYPNPTQGAITVDLGNVYTNVTVRILTQVGQEIQHTTYSNKQEIDLFIDGVRGTYFAEITTNRGYAKLVKLIKID